MNVADALDLGGRRRVPLVRQAEASECGLACLAMIAAYHGLEVDMPALRRRYPSSLRGVGLKSLIDMADRLGFVARALRAEPEDLGDIELPAILHWGMNHFVVLTRITTRLGRSRYHIHDPSDGSRVIEVTALRRKLTGVVLELAKGDRFRPVRARSPLRMAQLWSGIRGAGRALSSVLLLSFILQFVALALPFFLQLGVDNVLPAADDQLLNVLALGFGGLVLINVFTTWLRTVSLLGLSSSFSFQVVNNLYRHLLSLPLSWFEKRHVGDVISRFQSTQPVTDLLGQGLITAIIDGTMVSLTLILMFVYSPILAGLAVAAWVLYISIRVASFAAMRRSNAGSIAAAAAENSAFIETVRGISTIKAFGREATRQRMWQSLKARAINAQLKLGRISASFDAGSNVILGLERVLFVYVAIRLAIHSGFSVGMIFAFQAYKQQFLDAATRLVDQGVKYKLIDVHLTRIADIALSTPEPVGRRWEVTAGSSGQIELRNVSFRYGVGEPDILRNTSLHIRPGEMIALVGPSGGGKTTLLKLIMGLLEPTGGEILIDGLSLKQLGSQAWRSRLGSVLQDDRLFAGSLAENVCFFEPEPDMERVRAVCEQAAILNDIERMPLGLETLVGDMGSSLSGGQRQRVLLARALYVKPDVLFMDEGTANLDHASEAIVLASLKALRITRVISAHRAPAINAASRTALVENGTVRLLGPAYRPT